MAITEAMLVDYAGMYLIHQDGVLAGRLSPRLDRPELSVIASLPHRTPWRVFMLSDSPAGLMESNILVSFVIHAPRLIWAGFAGKLEFKQ